MIQFKMSLTLTDLDLHSILGRSGVLHRIGTPFYSIRFNGRDLSDDTSEGLFTKIKEEYKMYVNLNNYYKNGI